MFQFLSPVLSNNGQCHRENKYLMAALLIICGLNCAFATFTDSHKDEEGNTRYGVVTVKGMWRPSSRLKGAGHNNVDLSEYRVCFKDFMHAILGFLVFSVVAMLDSNTVDCFALNLEGYPREGILKGLPIVVGGICSVIFVVFPSKRNGIGYPSGQL
ncbi:hypothetical protein RND81_10G009100 [Saponaria officinalis]|uniref:Uncharacterized protein n=1 Tax=Saponaria officinalis TaxID=3572 RepID=A0AAW1HZ67_SAPOF